MADGKKPAKAPDKKGGDKKANRRGAARLAAVQALYQMDLAATPLGDILAEFESHWIGREVEGQQYLPAEAAFFREVVSGVVADQRKLDPMIDTALARGWPLKRIETVLRSSTPAFSPDGNDEAKNLARAWSGSNVVGSVVYGTEAGIFKKTLGVPTVVCGPGDIAQAHQPNEFILASQITACEGFMQRMTEWGTGT